jgi:hypothetical protein
LGGGSAKRGEGGPRRRSPRITDRSPGCTGERRPASILQRGRRFRIIRTPRPRRAQEDRIPQAYDTIDRALKTHKRGSRRLSLVIVVLGLIAVAAAFYFSPDRRRQRAARSLPRDADTALVLRTLGPRPTRCPTGRLDHLRGQTGLDGFNEDSVMIQLQRDTRERWIYPGKTGCTPQAGETELGIDAAGRTLWLQPASEHGNLTLSPRISY